MSNQVDNRVVSMEFDNSRFEKNVQTSMSTLDKLKQKLHLPGAAKGIEEVDRAARKVDMSNMSKGVETVHAKFSALEIMGITALTNITNKAVDAGLKIAKALTIDPVTTGLSEYETKMNAVQVIKSNTRDKYDDEVTQMADIEKALSDLNDYADRTIYNYTQMTSNVGKFVAQGLGVEEATKAVQGLANLAGASGATAEDMARATYQMSQALGGTIRKMDWNSLRNANMATVQLKNTLMDFARVEGIDIDGMIKEKGTFEDTLEKGWLTGDLFTKAMNVYSDVYSEAELKAMGFKDEQIANFKELAKEAQSATTEVKTMSQLWDVLKETAQSGWTQTWELIFGGFNEAKAMFTELQEYFSGIINAFSNARNFVLGIALNFKSIWQGIAEKLDKAGLGKITEAIDNIKGGLKDLKYWQDIVTKVWRGDYNNWGDNPDRFEWLEKDGYNHKVVQDLVNLGYKHKITMEEVEASHKKFGLTMDKTDTSTKKTTNTVAALTDEQLRLAGLTEDEISLYRALEREAARLGMTFDDLVSMMSEIDGRSLLIDSFKNLWDGISGIFKAIKQAYLEIFNPPGLGELGVRLYGLIVRFNEFTEKLRLTDRETGKLNDNGKKIVRTFKGIFAIIDIVTTLIGGPLKIAFKIISKIVSAVLDAFGMTLLDVTAIVGDALVKFRDWIDSILDFGAIFKWLLPYLVQAKDAVVDWYNATKPFAGVGKWFSDAFAGIKQWFADLKKVDNIPKYIFEGLVNGLKAGVKAVGNVIATVANYIIDVFCNIFGIHSPSVVFFTLGGFIIAGLIMGINTFAPGVWDALKGVGQKCIDIFKELDLGGIFTAAIAAIGAHGLTKMVDAFGALASGLDGLGDFLEGIGIGIKRALTGVGKYFKAKAWEARSKALLNFAFAIGVLAASVWVLAQIDPGRLWGAIGALTVLAGVMVGLMLVMSKMSKAGSIDIGKSGVQVKTVITQLIPIALSMILLASAVKKLGSLSLGDFIQGSIGLVLLGGFITGLLALLKVIGPGVDKLGSTLLKISFAILILVVVVKMIGSMNPEKLVVGIAFIGMFLIIIGIMTLITKFAGRSMDKLGGTLIKMSLAIAILAFVARMIGGMDPKELAIGIKFIDYFIAIIIKLTIIAVLVGGRTLGKLGSMLIGMSVAIAIMAFVVRILGGMDPAKLVKGILAVNLLAAVIIKLVAAVKTLGGNKVGMIGATMLAFAIAIAVMGAVVALLGLLKISSLVKGIVAMGLMTIMMKEMIKATKDARNCYKNIMMMAVVIGVMALSIFLLSFIDSKSLAAATAAMVSVIGIFALLITTMKSLKSIKGAQKEIFKTLILLASTIAVLALVIFALSFMPKIPEHVASQLPIVGSVMAMMTVLLFPLALIGKIGLGTVMKGILALTTMLVPLCALIAVLAFMPKFPSHVIDQIPVIGMALTALTLLLFPLILVGTIGIGAAMVGILALTTMLIPLCGLIAVLAFMPEFPSYVTEQLKALLPALAVMSLLMPVLALAGLGGPAALIGIGSLMVLIVAIGALATLCGALGDGFKNLLEKGLPMLVMIAGAIGEMIGAFIGGIAIGICNALPPIGQALCDFMKKATPFIDGCKNVDGAVLKGASILTLAILELTVADIVNLVGSIFTGGLADLGSDLSAFMKNAKDFIAGAKTITPEVANGIKCLGDAILSLTSGNLIQGITDWITGGDSSLETFGKQLGGLGENLREFADNLGTFDDNTVKTVGCACDAIKKLAEASESLPSQGGWVEKIVGGNSLAQFGDQLGGLGTNLSTFITNLTTNGAFDDATVKTVECAGSAIKALADAASKLPNDGGFMAGLLGDNSLATFGDKLPDLGTNLAQFITNLTSNSAFNGDTVKTVECAGEAIKALADAAATIPNTGGFWSSIVGDNSLADFGDKLPSLATNLKDYVGNLGAFGPDAIEAAYVAVDVVTSIAELAKAGDVGDLADGVDDLNEVLGDFGSAIKSLVGNVTKDVKGSTIDTAVSYFKKVIDMVKSATAVDSGAFENFIESLESVSDDVISDFVDAFNSKDAAEEVKSSVGKLMSSVITGLKAKQEEVNEAFTKAASTAATKVATKGKGGTITAFEQAGKDLGAGLIKGIEAKYQSAYDAAYELGKQAVKGEKDGQQSKSPSKLTIKAGKWLGEGLIIGMQDMMKAVYNAGHDLGDGATGTISSAISKITDVVNSDIDAQPTIRPVLDLSDVSAGAGTISRMLSMNPSVGVLAKTGSINTMMNERQNGNGDVVSAIKDLKKTIGNKSGDTYQFGNVTYGDDSAVSDAVGALVRAIRVEGRT